MVKTNRRRWDWRETYLNQRLLRSSKTHRWSPAMMIILERSGTVLMGMAEILWWKVRIKQG